MTKITAEIKGLNKVLERLNKVNIDTKDGVMKGLLAGGLLVQRRAQKRTPVEYGLLRASAFTRKGQDNAQVVEVGYGSRYALFVHEKTAEKLRGKKRRSGIGTYWNPGESKFLTKAFEESKSDIVKLVTQHVVASAKPK